MHETTWTNINCHLLVLLASPLYHLLLALDIYIYNSCTFHSHNFHLFKLHNFGASSPVPGNFSNFSRFVKKKINTSYSPAGSFKTLRCKLFRPAGVKVFWACRCWLTSSLIQLATFLLHLEHCTQAMDTFSAFGLKYIVIAFHLVSIIVYIFTVYVYAWHNDFFCPWCIWKWTFVCHTVTFDILLAPPAFLIRH